MKWYDKIKAVHLAVTDAVAHRKHLKGNRYFVWQEDGTNRFCADGRQAERAVTGTTDLYTRLEYDPWVEAFEAALDAAADRLGWPLFVKPVRAGSSYGIAKVNGLEQLAPAVMEAFRHDREVILEEAVPGFEVGCAVLGNDELTVGLVDEIELSGGFFDFDEKYTLKTSAIHCPARISPEKAAEIQEAAKTVYRALDCKVFARVDFFLTPDGRVVFNEVNTIPGFTSHSRYPNMMKGAGLDFSALLDKLVELGFKS